MHQRVISQKPGDVGFAELVEKEALEAESSSSGRKAAPTVAANLLLILVADACNVKGNHKYAEQVETDYLESVAVGKITISCMEL